MPNWASNRVIIQGDNAVLDEIQDKLATPYTVQFPDDDEPREIAGNFMLWNIVAPDDLQAYFHQDEAEKKPKGMTPGDFLLQMHRDLHESNFWYSWNVRNWGTKWDIIDAELTKSDRSLTYEFESAWTPPIEAIAKLASEYPEVTITAKFMEAGVGFAGIVMFENGKIVVEQDYELNHATMMDFDDFCWVCGYGTDEWGIKELDEEAVKAYGCREYLKDIEELNQKLGGE